MIERFLSSSATIAPPLPDRVATESPSATTLLNADTGDVVEPLLVASEDDEGPLDRRDLSLTLFWGTMLFSFLVAFVIWWVLYEYSQHPGQLFGLGLWVPNDRPSWLPLHSSYTPLLGQHYFGDFFQLYYAVRTHAPYTNALAPTAVNPGYLLPLALVSWLPYPAGGFVYLGGLLVAWILPALAIARRSHLLALLYFVATTLSIPGLLALDIGQPEIFLYVLAVFAFYLLARRPMASVVLIGLAIAIKPYMALFLLLYLFRKQYRLAIYAVLIAIATNFVTAVYLVHGAVLRWHLWSVILHASLGYGSGNGLKFWNQAPFLRSNASLYGLLYTLGPAHVPGLSSAAHFLVKHYTPVSLAVLGLALVLLWRLHKRLTMEVQWLYLAIVFLLVPSFTIGYAWLLLFVPFVAAAMAKGHGTRSEGNRLGLFQSRPLIVVVALSVVAYPANIALPAMLAASNPAYGPSGNTVVTPLLLVAALALIAWNARRPVTAPELGGRASPEWATERRENIRTASRSLYRLKRSIGVSVVVVLLCQAL